MGELEQHLKNLSKSLDLKGLILYSAKPSIFIAGADINEILKEGITDADLRNAVESGQRVFNFLEKMGIPTVAAIHGACMGGGYELCLACRHRIASDHKSTKIGLPETSVGYFARLGWFNTIAATGWVTQSLRFNFRRKTVCGSKGIKDGYGR